MSIALEAIRRRNGRVDRYRQLVRPIALHYAARCPEPLDDLIQVGLLGLLRAAERFEEASATPFDAFARPHIRGSILHYLRDRSQPIRLPRRLQEQLDLRRRILAEWRTEWGNRSNQDQIRQVMGLNESQWEQLERARQLSRPLQLLAEVEERLPASEPEAQDPPDSAQRALAALATLEPSLAAVVQRVVLSGWSYRRTAHQLAISPMTVQRRLHKGLAQLRQQLNLSPLRDRRRDPSAAPAC